MTVYVLIATGLVMLAGMAGMVRYSLLHPHHQVTFWCRFWTVYLIPVMLILVGEIVRLLS